MFWAEFLPCCTANMHMCGWQPHVLIDANHMLTCVDGNHMFSLMPITCSHRCLSRAHINVCHMLAAQQTSCVSGLHLHWQGIRNQTFILHIKTFPSSCTCSLHMSEGNLSFSQSAKIQKIKNRKENPKSKKHLWSSGSAR